MPKSYISTKAFSTGQSVAADSITLDGLPFTALLPDQEHKHVGAPMTMTGNFEVGKEYVRGEMQCLLESLNADEVLSPSLKELAMKVCIISLFCYSTDLVPWSLSELSKSPRCGLLDISRHGTRRRLEVRCHPHDPER